MAERSDQIARHIESTRSELGSNLHELEHKLRQEADWRTHFERNPMTVMGLAFAGGVLLATMSSTSGNSGRNRGRVLAAEEYQNGNRPASGIQPTQISDSWNTLKGALIGLAGAKVRSVLDEALPGFSEQYDKAERSAPTSASRIPGRDFDSPTHRM